MGILISIGILIVFMLIISFASYIFVNVLLLISNKNELLRKIMLKLKNQHESKWKYLISVILLVLAGVGIYQATIYYLTSGAYFWFVIFTMGLLLLVYIAPIGSMFMPFIKKEFKNWNKFSIFYWNFIGATSWLWGILLIVDRSAIIYEDESGANFHYGSLPLKTGGGICLFIVAIYMTATIASKKYE